MAERILIIQPDVLGQPLVDFLKDSYEVLTADLTEDFLGNGRCPPDVVLLGAHAADQANLDVCRRIKFVNSQMPPQVIFVPTEISPGKRLAVYESGADDCLSMPLEAEELGARIGIQIRLRQALAHSWSLSTRMESYAAELERLVDSKAAALEATQDVTVFALAKLADSRDPETGDHLERMRVYSQILARQLRHEGPYTHQIDDQFLEDLYRASPLHDVGKVGIPDSILLKPGRLTPEEFERMKLHTIFGAETLEEAARHAGGCRFLKMAVQIARHHHERFDGTGYPSGLKGLEIPLAARIVALADVYDALTSQRVYKSALEPSKARELIVEQSGRHFDPAIVDVFLSCYGDFLKVPSAVYGGGIRTNSQIVVTGDADYDVTALLQEPFPCLPGGKVLLVGDDQSLPHCVSAWLEEAGYRVRRETTGHSAVRQILDECPQIVVADWMLADMSGVEFSRTIRRQRLPFYVYAMLVLSEARKDQLASAAEGGADDFLFRPVTQEELLARLRSAERFLKLLRELSQRPRLDPLTGVATMRLIGDQLGREWRRAGRYNIPLSCAVIDIDRFSQLNAKVGVAQGDVVLQSVAGLLHDNCRPTDYLFRRGPDSFCMVLTETNEHGASAWAERLRVLISGIHVLSGLKEGPVTASIGVAQRRVNHQNIEDLIETAEQTLLVAKQLGGNRMIRFGALGDTENLQTFAERQGSVPFQGLVARDVMSAPISTLHQDDTIEAAAGFLMRYRINSAPVVDNDGHLAGIVSEKDLMNMMVSSASWQRPLREAMTTDVVAYDENHSVYSIYKFLLGSPIRRVVVVNGQRPTGVISRGTLLRSFGNWNLEQSMNGGETVDREMQADVQLAGEAQRLAAEVHEAAVAHESASTGRVAR